MNVTSSTPKRNQYDSVFRHMFHRKEALLELYNAVSGSQHTDESALEINTLSNAIYIAMRNDVSFIMDFQIHLYEHQSTINPNMPLRDLLYITQLYMKDISIRQLYSTKPLELPFPVFIVFYNGKDPMPESMEYHLSDLFHPLPLPVNLDLRVRVLNINPGYNEELMAQSPYLRAYQIYSDKVRRYSAVTTLEAAVERAVQECIKENVLKEFFTKNRREIMDMSFFEFDYDLYLEVQREEAMERGLEQGLEQGLERGESRLSALNKHLLAEQRYEDLNRASSDKEYRHSLYCQYGIA